MGVKKAREIPELPPHVGQTPANSVCQPQCSHRRVTGLFRLGVIPWDVTESLPRPCSPQAATLSALRSCGKEPGSALRVWVGNRPRVSSVCVYVGNKPRVSSACVAAARSVKPRLRVCGDVARTSEQVTAEAVVLSWASEPMPELGWGQDEGQPLTSRWEEIRGTSQPRPLAPRSVAASMDTEASTGHRN